MYKKQKQKSISVNHPSTPNFEYLPYTYPKVGRWFFSLAKMTAKDDPIISCSLFVAETSTLAAWKKKILKGVAPSGRQGLIFWCLIIFYLSILYLFI